MDSINFLPERIRLQRARRRRMVRQGYVVLAFAAVLAVLGYMWQVRIAQARSELSALERRQAGMDQESSVRRSLESQLADLLVKKRIDEHLGSRVNALDVLAELSKILPESMAMSSLNLEAVEFKVPVEPVEKDPARTAPGVIGLSKAREQTVKRVRLVITGLAPTDVDVANFIGQMSASPVFEDVNMGYAKTTVFSGRAGREFQASCYLAR